MNDEHQTISVVVPSGMLGVGVGAEQIGWGLSQGARAVAVDAGSTDSGASCLATGVSKISREAIKRDLKITMQVALPAGVPILVGSCGTAGTDMGVDWTLDVVQEIARELGENPKIAALYSEVEKQNLLRAMADGKVRALAPTADLNAETVRDCNHIVALMGPEPYIEALKSGADIVLADARPTPQCWRQCR